MSQHDYILGSHPTGLELREELNLMLAAIATQNSGPGEPADKYAGMVWLDTTNNLVKRRNLTNTAWIIVGILGQHMDDHSVYPYVAATGGTGNYVLTYSPAIPSLRNGARYWFKADVACVINATAHINGLGAKSLKKLTSAGYANVAAGDILADQLVGTMYLTSLDSFLIFTESDWNGAVKPEIQVNAYTSGVATGSGGNYALIVAPAISAYAAFQKFIFKTNHAAGGGSTLAVCGLTAKTIKKYNSSGALVAAESVDMPINKTAVVIYDAADNSFVLQNPAKLYTAPSIAILRDKKANGVAGGTFTSGAWRTRTLNDENDPDGIVGLSASQFMLQAGTYFIRGTAPAYTVQLHQLRLYNVTGAVVIMYGQNAFADIASGCSVQNAAEVVAHFTIAEATVFEIQHRCSLTKTDGLGLAVSFGGDEIYTVVTIEKR